MKKSNTTITEFVMQEFIDDPHNELTANDIAQTLGIRNGTVSNIIYNLVKRNKLLKTDFGKYQLYPQLPTVDIVNPPKEDKSVEYDIILIKILTRSTYKYRSREILEHIKDILDEKTESVKIEKVRAAEDDEFKEIKVVRLK